MAAPYKPGTFHFPKAPVDVWEFRAVIQGQTGFSGVKGQNTCLYFLLMLGNKTGFALGKREIALIENSK